MSPRIPGRNSHDRRARLRPHRPDLRRRPAWSGKRSRQL